MAAPWRDVAGVRIAPARVCFKDVVLGVRYRAALSVQNRRVESCRLRLLPPRRPQFKLIVENPEKPLASGLQVTAFVEYCPDREEDLQDRLHLLIEDERVDIPLLGLMPCCQLQIEPEINFGAVVANSKIISKEISITNHGSSSGAFTISYAGAVLLSIEPATGVVEPNSVKTVRVEICTDVPRLIKEVIKVELEGHDCTEVWIKAVVVEQVLKVLAVPGGNVVDCLHFGPVYFGSSKAQQIALYNPSPECLHWVAVLEDNAIGEEMGTDLQRSADAALQDLSLRGTRDGDVSTLILCIPSQGTLLPYKKSLVTLCFSPKEFRRAFRVPECSQKQDYVLFLRFEVVGNQDGYLQSLAGDATDITETPPQQVELALTGSGLPVQLTFNPGPVIQFMECLWGEQTQVLCTLSNESELLPVTFSFHRTAHFSVSPEKGRIQPKSAKEVMFSFSPHQIGTLKVKQVVDIIGKGLEKNNSQVLKKKSFHQIYLSLTGVCKPNQNHILFKANPGMTPVVSNAPGQFVAAGRGECPDTAPLAVLQSAQSQSHSQQTNRSWEGDALPAVPKQPAGSLRPSEWNQKHRTAVSKPGSYSCREAEFAYTASERLSRAAHKQLYRDFLSALRQQRLQKEATRQFSIYNNSVNIGLKPAGGLLPPKISLTDLHKEELQLKMLPLDENCLLTSQKLAAIGSRSSLREVRSGLSAVPSSTQEKEDCSLTLTPKQLHQILIGPSTIDFGDVCVYSTTVRKLHIINNLLVHIWLQIEMEMDELVHTSPLSQVVPPLTRTHIPIVFETETPGMFKRSFSYTINNQHLGHVLVVAKAVSAELELSARELILSPISGYLAETEFRTTVRIHNPRNHAAEFTWRPVPAARAPAFSIQPAKGFVEAYGDLECEVVWQPGFSSPEAGEFHLCVRKGNTVKLKCFAKLGVTKVRFLEQRIPFSHSPVGLATCKPAFLLNTGCNHAYFQVLDCHPLPGMTISPAEGVVPVGGHAQLTISFTPAAKGSVAARAERFLKATSHWNPCVHVLELKTFSLPLCISVSEMDYMVAVRGAGVLLLGIAGAADIPQVTADVELFDFGGVYLGSTKSIPFLLQNKGQACATVEFDFSKYKDFKLIASDESVLGCCSSKPAFYSVSLKGKAAVQCFLSFMPKEVAAYDFTLPLRTPGSECPVPEPSLVSAPSAASARHAAAPQPQALPMAPLLCRVKAVVLKSPLEFSSMELTFTQHSSGKRLNIAEESLSCQQLDLKNVSRQPLTWKLSCADAGQKTEDGTFKCSLRSGFLAPGQAVSIAVFFCPSCPGTYRSEMSVCLNDNPAPYKITLTGTVKSPKLSFDPPFLLLMPVPLDVSSEATFSIIPEGYLRQSPIHVELPELELEGGAKLCPFAVQFPEGQDIVLSSDGTNKPLSCHISFRSPQPVSLLGKMFFTDEEENRFLIQVAATAENCLLTLYPYLACHGSDHQIIMRSSSKDYSSGEVVLQPCYTPQSLSCSLSSTSFGASTASTSGDPLSESDTTSGSESDRTLSEESGTDSQRDGRENNMGLSFFPAEDEEEYTFFQKTLTAVKNWFTLFGWPEGQNPISIPYSLRRDVCKVQVTSSQENASKANLGKGTKTLYDMVFHLSGQLLPGITSYQSLPLDPGQRTLQLHWQHATLLAFLKSQGAYLPHVMPEFLLEPDDYKKWIEVQTVLKGHLAEVKDSGVFSEQHLLVLEDSMFERVSKRAWMDLLLQLYKVFVLARVSPCGIPDLFTSGSLQSMPRIKAEPLSSNIYSPSERVILSWLNKHYEENRETVWKECQKGEVPPRRWIVNFDRDLLDGLVLAAQLAAYCPYLITTHFVRMYTKPRSPEQFLHNCLILVSAMHAVRLLIDIKATDICEPNPVLLLLLCVYLYESLPHYLPQSTIEFAGALHAAVVKQVCLKNPSSKTLVYKAVLVGRDADHFSLPRGSTVTIAPKGQASVAVAFRSRFLRPAAALLLLSSGSVGGSQGLTLSFALKAEVKHVEPAAVLKCKSPCYELRKVTLTVTSPFSSDGMFSVLNLGVFHQGCTAASHRALGDAFVIPVGLLQQKWAEHLEQVILLESPSSFLQPEQVDQARRGKQEHMAGSGSSTLSSTSGALPAAPQEEHSFSCSAQPSLLQEFFSPKEKLFLQGRGSAALEIHFLPFHLGKRYCTLLLTEEQVGEFLCLIEGTGDAPLPSRLLPMDSPNVLHVSSTLEGPSAAEPVLYLKCGLSQIVEENLRIPLINESRERALAIAAQQQMSCVEYGRRKLAGTLQGSSVRVAAAWLGLSRAEREALLKPGRVLPGGKCVEYSVEVSRPECFQLPHKFSIPVLASSRVQLELPSPQEAAGRDAVELPMKFLAQGAGLYHCQILLRASWDVRVYQVACVVSTGPAEAQLDFLSRAYQAVTQHIPISNMSSQEWKLEAVLEGQGFSGPAVITVAVGGTAMYPLTFKPVAECIAMGRLLLRNDRAGTELLFSLKGIGKKPLAQDCVVIDCQVRKVTQKILWVPNYTKKLLMYKVSSDLSMVSGAPTITVGPDDKMPYTLTVSPWRRGVSQGVISFVAEVEEHQQPPHASPEKRGGDQALQKLPGATAHSAAAAGMGPSSPKCEVWFSLKINSKPAAPEGKIDVKCRALDTVAFHVPVSNPSDELLQLRVLLENQALSGQSALTLRPREVFFYQVTFSPAVVGTSDESVIFLSELLGEFWYALRLTVEKPLPTRLPEIECELGKWTRLAVPLVNPTGETLQLEIVNSNPVNFSPEADPKQPLIVAPHSTTEVPVQFCPSALGKGNQKASITFRCPQLQEWIFYLSGIGLLPQLMEPTSTSAFLGQCSSVVISFKNPTCEKVLADVVLTDKEQFSSHLSASLLSQATSKGSVFHLLLKQARGIPLAPKGKLHIPVLFSPETMQRGEAVVVIHLRRADGQNWHYEYSAELNQDLKSVIVGENGQLQGILWIYPVCGIPEALQQKSVAAVLRCPARQRVERRVQVLLSAVVPLPATGKSQDEAQVTDGFSTTEEFLYDLQYPSHEMKCQLDPVLAVHLAERDWDTAAGAVTLSFHVVFAPNRPMRSKATLRVQCTTGGVWRFPLLFIATKPKVDDVISIAAVGLNKESVVGFKLTSQTRNPEPFTASFLAGSDPEFFVLPQTGELLPAGTVGTPIRVGFKPRMYGKKHRATLVIETQSMQWLYDIQGLPPETLPPPRAAKVVCRGSCPGSAAAPQRDFLRENLRLGSTGVSSPIKGAPLVPRTRGRRL